VALRGGQVAAPRETDVDADEWPRDPGGAADNQCPGFVGSILREDQWGALARTSEAEVEHRQCDIARGHHAVLVDVASRTHVDPTGTADDADHAGDLGSEDDAVEVTVAAAFAEGVQTGLARTATRSRVCAAAVRQRG